MFARLILNADDFGLTSGINRCVRELHLAGVLSSATLMANGPAFEEAAAIARSLPELGVGCHVVLVDGTPVSPANEIPTLLGPDGRNFRPTLSSFMQATLFGKIRAAEVEREALAQIQKLQRAGIDVTHIDTHKHTHIFPVIAKPLLRLLSRTSITAIRNPFEAPWSIPLGGSNHLRRFAVRQLSRFEDSFLNAFELRSGAIKTTEGAIGVSATGRLNAASLAEIAAAIPREGTWELVCHPGYHDDELDRQRTRLREQRETEREALLEVIPGVLTNPRRTALIHYGELGVAGTLRSLGQFHQDSGYEKVL